jgi:glycogen debranching enzyme
MTDTRPPGNGGPAYHVLASAERADDRTRVLKHNDTFAVFDHYGDVKPGGLGEEGLYHEGTRYLSRLQLELDGRRPFLLGSTIREENDQLTVALTNPDLLRDCEVAVGLGTLHLRLRTFLWRAACHRQLRVTNHGPEPVAVTLRLHFSADFADIFEVRGMKRKARGRDLPPRVDPDHVVLAYQGLDAQTRRTALRFRPQPDHLTADTARYDLVLGPGVGAALDLAIACLRGGVAGDAVPFDEARAEAEAALRRQQSWACHVRSADGQFDAWVRRAESDLHMMISDTPHGPYPYAGVPWFNTPFGRDGILTALECLWLWPELSRGVLAYLAATQATAVVPAEDAEPGKILHETRQGEMAVLGEMPFGRYYGSVDATPLFVLLAGAYYERTGDRAFVEGLWPHIEAALAWIDRDGDPDGDGFVEYQRRCENGLLHQGWKDSDDAVFHADGTPAAGPIALCEVQGYVYAARRAASTVAAVLGQAERAAELQRRAEALRQRFEEAFWCEELGTYALALDGDKRPCRVRSSSAGHCLFAGIAGPGRASRVAAGLLAADSYSGWGVRTLPAGTARYNPMAYHNGSVWPHDNALIAYGLSRYGMQDGAARLLAGMFEAGACFDLQRMPELFCGFDREPGEGPTLYPVACAPQAWAAASVFLLLQACLGLWVSGAGREVLFTRPRLPPFLREVRITNLAVAGATVDLLLLRHEGDVGVNVLRRDGDVAVTVAK